tara:strand:- start:90532 stop:93744 length:3213 start_codon:yes stop_codon:yes gene_type:complete
MTFPSRQIGLAPIQMMQYFQQRFPSLILQTSDVRLWVIALFITITSFIPVVSQEIQDPVQLVTEGVVFREVGPAIMGGRISDIAVNPDNPANIFVGFATAGLWKTTSDGMAWEPKFDNQVTASIGAVSIAPSNPNIVWVGTGEPQNRQSSPYGFGVFKSVDGGDTWVSTGLSQTRHIGRIVVHPQDPDVVFVAAVGHLWGANDERGVFKTTDGGDTWEKVLYIDEDTGAIDLVISPEDPNTLFAAMYQRRRTAFGFSASGSGSGIYRTYDGGESWQELNEGLPEGDKGRIGLDIYQGDGSLLYATVESVEGEGRGIYRTTDRGDTWEKVSERNPRPMYFSMVRIDPNNPERIYLGGVQLSISDDGGKTWWEGDAAEGIHVDHHALWVNPENSEHVILGSDGGLSTTRDGGQNWRMYDNMSVGQFYEIGFDMQHPYHVCGGLQDNSSWCAPNQTLNNYGVRNSDWEDVSGGDGFYNQVDPTNPNIVYTESQGGNISRLDRSTGSATRIRPVARSSEVDEERSYDFNWNAPIVVSEHDPNTVYIGANHLLRSRDQGMTWEEASPDLTRLIDRDTLEIMGRPLSEPHLSRNDGISSYGNITAISESSFSPSVIYVGTDDGNLQVTRDGGDNWMVVENRPGLPPGTYVSRLQASRHSEGRVYASFDAHNDGDYKPYLYVSEDYGASWQSISSDLPDWSINVVREHHLSPNLLFLGNEVGVYVSFNRGSDWQPLKGNFPTVPVDDIAIHPRENDLIVGTHGRSIWILHDLGPLQEIAEDPAILGNGLQSFQSKPGTQWIRSGGWPFWGDMFIAENPEDGVRIRYWLGEELALGEVSECDQPVCVEILDTSLRPISKLAGPGKAGFHEILWDMRYELPSDMEDPNGGGFGPPLTGPMVLPGSYQARIMAGLVTSEIEIEVQADPRDGMSDADRNARYEAAMSVFEMLGLLGQARDASERLGGQLEDVETLLDSSSEVTDSLRSNVGDLKARLDDATEDLSRLNRMSRLLSGIEGSATAPTADQLYQIDLGMSDLTEVITTINELIGEGMPGLNTELDHLGIRPDPGNLIEIPTVVP